MNLKQNTTQPTPHPNLIRLTLMLVAANNMTWLPVWGNPPSGRERRSRGPHAGRAGGRFDRAAKGQMRGASDGTPATTTAAPGPGSEATPPRRLSHRTPATAGQGPQQPRQGGAGQGRAAFLGGRGKCRYLPLLGPARPLGIYGNVAARCRLQPVLGSGFLAL